MISNSRDTVRETAMPISPPNSIPGWNPDHIATDHGQEAIDAITAYSHPSILIGTLSQSDDSQVASFYTTTIMH